MNQIMTANVASNLYWLGRHLERLEATLIELLRTYDTIIDQDFHAGKSLYARFGIELDYENAKGFIIEAVQGEHDAKLTQLVENLRENAIIARNHIESEAFGSIIQLHKLFTCITEKTHPVDFVFIDMAQSLVSEIWGQLSRKQSRNVNDYFLRFGKYVEKVDFHLRMGRSLGYAVRLKDELESIIYALAPNSKIKIYSKNDTPEEILEKINNNIHKIIVES